MRYGNDGEDLRTATPTTEPSVCPMGRTHAEAPERRVRHAVCAPIDSLAYDSICVEIPSLRGPGEGGRPCHRLTARTVLTSTSSVEAKVRGRRTMGTQDDSTSNASALARHIVPRTMSVSDVTRRALSRQLINTRPRGGNLQAAGRGKGHRSPFSVSSRSGTPKPTLSLFVVEDVSVKAGLGLKARSTAGVVPPQFASAPVDARTAHPSKGSQPTVVPPRAPTIALGIVPRRRPRRPGRLRATFMPYDNSSRAKPRGILGAPRADVPKKRKRTKGRRGSFGNELPPDSRETRAGPSRVSRHQYLPVQTLHL